MLNQLLRHFFYLFKSSINQQWKFGFWQKFSKLLLDINLKIYNSEQKVKSLSQVHYAHNIFRNYLMQNQIMYQNSSGNFPRTLPWFFRISLKFPTCTADWKNRRLWILLCIVLQNTQPFWKFQFRDKAFHDKAFCKA